ncbi:NAD(P)/FAD-dependent oxidoreductase [Nocardia sp. NPDC051570]|uniref:NAD(P)/FAD-dependent oxidoreductase n=1 Tax=Nocardia sp. NPDC051570 TaxID=3364324 RepID=UPI0037877298
MSDWIRTTTTDDELRYSLVGLLRSVFRSIFCGSTLKQNSLTIHELGSVARLSAGAYELFGGVASVLLRGEMVNRSTQVLVVGGGPAGSTVASLLAREGIDVTLMEKENFPRYHIGESLVPSCVPILELLGVRDKIESHGFQKKCGALFDWGGERWDVTFGEKSDEGTYSYQVQRAEFDHLLLEHAKSLGVTVLEGVEVKRLVFDGDRPRSAIWVEAGSDDKVQEHEIGFDYIIDASGRAGLMNARHLRTRRYHDVFQNIAVWGYWEGAKPLPAGPEGAIAICYVTDGWLWGIPLSDGQFSVGLVTHKDLFRTKRQEGQSLDEIYQAAIKESPVIADMLAPAQLVSPLGTEKDYSYTSEQFAGPGYFLVGDAACFLDPLLSTGVHLAMYSAMVAAASLASVLRGEFTEGAAQQHYEKAYRQAYLRLMLVVSSLYQKNGGTDSYFWEAQRLTLRDCSDVDLKQSFVDVISGIEDLRDAQATLDLALETTGKAMAEWGGWHWKPSDLNSSDLNGSEWKKALEQNGDLDALSAEERELQEVRSQFFDTALQRPPTTLPEDARGLYVVTKPRLGLALLS